MTGPPGRPGAPEYGPKDLMLIRASFLMGVLMFGGVVFFLHRGAGAPSEPAPDMLIYVPIGAAAVALLAFYPLRSAMMRATDNASRMTLMMAGWGLGEFAALAGGVYYFLTDDPRFALSGVFVLLASFILFPIKRPD